MHFQLFHKFNINPDIVVHIDSEDIQKFYELTKPSKDKQIRNFVIDTRVPPEIFNYPTKNIYTFPFSPHYNYKASHMFGLKYRDFSGPNVTIFSVRLVQHLGIKNITLIGNDLSFDDDKLYMDNCNLESEENRHLKKQKIYVDGYYGDKVRTSPDFELFIKSFEILFKILKKKSNSFKLFNSTEGGALLKRWENIPLETFIKKFSNNKEKIISTVKSTKKYKENIKLKSIKFLKSNIIFLKNN